MMMHLIDDNRLPRLLFIHVEFFGGSCALVITLVIDISGTYVKQFAITATRVLVCI